MFKHFLGKGYKICDWVAGPPSLSLKKLLRSPRKDQMEAVSSRVIHGSSHSCKTLFPISTCPCIQTLAHAEVAPQGYFWMPQKLLFPKQTYKLTWKPALQKYKTQTNT